jgi:hypothetical protein
LETALQEGRVAGIQATLQAGRQWRGSRTRHQAKNYPAKLAKEIAALRNSEMWQAGAAVRALRPHEKAKAIKSSTKGVTGRKG